MEEKIVDITRTKQRILQLLDQFKIDNEGQKVTQWNILALKAVIQQELDRLEALLDKKKGGKNG